MNLEKTIKKLKKTVRTNFYFMRRRIDKGNGKKTVGWVLENENADYSYENKDFNVLHEKKLLLEN